MSSLVEISRFSKSIFELLVVDHVCDFESHIHLERVVEFRVKADGAALRIQQWLAIESSREDELGAETVGNRSIVPHEEDALPILPFEVSSVLQRIRRRAVNL